MIPLRCKVLRTTMPLPNKLLLQVYASTALCKSISPLSLSLSLSFEIKETENMKFIKGWYKPNNWSWRLIKGWDFQIWTKKTKTAKPSGTERRHNISHPFCSGQFSLKHQPSRLLARAKLPYSIGRKPLELAWPKVSILYIYLPLLHMQMMKLFMLCVLINCWILISGHHWSRL